MADPNKRKAKLAFEVVVNFAATSYVNYLEATLVEAVNQWNLLKGDREYAEPSDVCERAFWIDMDASQYALALSVWSWAKPKRIELSARWIEVKRTVSLFNTVFNGNQVWAPDEIEDLVEDVLYVLQPLAYMNTSMPHSPDAMEGMVEEFVSFED